MQKDFITVTPDSGTGDAIITVKVEETDALQNRESSLNISTSGIQEPFQLPKEPPFQSKRERTIMQSLQVITLISSKRMNIHM